MKWNGKLIALGILAAFGLLVGIVGIVGGLYMSTYIISIVLGSIFQVAVNGSLPVTNGTLEFMKDTEVSFFQVTGNVLTGAEFAGTLITIAIVLIVFAGLVIGGYAGYKALKNNKDKSGPDY